MPKHIQNLDLTLKKSSGSSCRKPNFESISVSISITIFAQTNLVIQLPENKIIFEIFESSRDSKRLQEVRHQYRMSPLAVVESRHFDVLQFSFIFWKWYKVLSLFSIYCKTINYFKQIFLNLFKHLTIKRN